MGARSTESYGYACVAEVFVGFGVNMFGAVGGGELILSAMVIFFA